MRWPNLWITVEKDEFNQSFVLCINPHLWSRSWHWLWLRKQPFSLGESRSFPSRASSWRIVCSHLQYIHRFSLQAHAAGGWPAHLFHTNFGAREKGTSRYRSQLRAISMQVSVRVGSQTLRESMQCLQIYAYPYITMVR